MDIKGITCILLQSVLIFCMQDQADCCSNHTEVQDSDLVLLGRVLQHFPGPRLMFTAEFHVECILKDSGQEVKPIFNISHAGKAPGGCFINNLTIGEDYYVFLKKLNSYLIRPSALEIPRNQGAQLLQSCGLIALHKTQGKTTVSPKCPRIKSSPCPTTKTLTTKRRTKPPRTRPPTGTRHASETATSSTTTSTISTKPDRSKPTSFNQEHKVAYLGIDHVTRMTEISTTTSINSRSRLQHGHRSSLPQDRTVQRDGAYQFGSNLIILLISVICIYV